MQASHIACVVRYRFGDPWGESKESRREFELRLVPPMLVSAGASAETSHTHMSAEHPLPHSCTHSRAYRETVEPRREAVAFTSRRFCEAAREIEVMEPREDPRALATL
eukprot:208831-Rhodomonas_salina.8